jgi:prepilin-type N-terminal cleavage/methylation domain-containing protein
MKNLLKKGFTLIELLIVIAIIGILSGLIITNVQGIRERARDSRRKTDLNSLRQSLRLYYNDAGSFPVSSNYALQGCGSFGSPATCNWGTSPFAVSNGGNTTTYMSMLPYDPSSSTAVPITYKYVSDGDTYIIVAALENLSDQDIADSQARCPNTYSAYHSGDSGSDTEEDYAVCEE